MSLALGRVAVLLHQRLRRILMLRIRDEGEAVPFRRDNPDQPSSSDLQTPGVALPGLMPTHFGFLSSWSLMQFAPSGTW